MGTFNQHRVEKPRTEVRGTKTATREDEAFSQSYSQYISKRLGLTQIFSFKLACVRHFPKKIIRIRFFFLSFEWIAPERETPNLKRQTLTKGNKHQRKVNTRH